MSWPFMNWKDLDSVGGFGKSLFKCITHTQILYKSLNGPEAFRNYHGEAGHEKRKKKIIIINNTCCSQAYDLNGWCSCYIPAVPMSQTKGIETMCYTTFFINPSLTWYFGISKNKNKKIFKKILKTRNFRHTNEEVKFQVACVSFYRKKPESKKKESDGFWLKRQMARAAGRGGVAILGTKGKEMRERTIKKRGQLIKVSSIDLHTTMFIKINP